MQPATSTSVFVQASRWSPLRWLGGPLTALFGLLALLAWLLAVVNVLEREQWLALANWGRFIALLLAAAYAARALTRQSIDKATRAVIWPVFLAALLFAAGEAAFRIECDLLGGNPDAVWWTNVPYLLACAALFGFAWSLPGVFVDGRERARVLVDLVLIGFTGLLLMYAGGMVESLRTATATLPTIQRTLVVVLPLSNTVLCSMLMACAVRLHRHGHSTVVWMLALAMLADLLGHLLWGKALVGDQVRAEDLGYAAWLVMGVAMLGACERMNYPDAVSTHSANTRYFVWLWRPMPLLAVLSVHAVAAVVAWRAGERTAEILIAASALLALLTLLKYRLTEHDNREIARQREALRGDRRLRLLLESTRDAVLVVEAEGRVSYVSPGMARLLGVSPQRLLGSHVRQWTDEAQWPTLKALIERAAQTPTLPLVARWRALRPDGRQPVVEGAITGYGHDAHIGGVVINVRDVTAQTSLEQRLRETTFTDALTGLSNRAWLVSRLDEALQQAQERSTTLGVFVFDVDHFKRINEQFGVDSADQVLCAYARRLRECAREGDLVARLDGDEFAVVAFDLASANEAALLAERMIAALDRPLLSAERSISLTTSAGATLASEGEDADLILRKASIALLRAKREGGGRCCFFSTHMQGLLLRKVELRARLQRALAEEELNLHYQPVLAMPGEQVAAVEALLRWRDTANPEPGADALIRSAAELGMMRELGQWSRERALRVMRELRRDANAGTQLRMSLNLSASELEDPQLVEELAALSDRNVVPRALVQLEVDEAVLRQPTAVQATLGALRDAGFAIVLDNFGAGSLSLEELRRLPIHGVKLPRAFISKATSHVHARELLAGIVAMSRALRLEVHAKGVENTAQARLLAQLGCGYAQGNLYAPPLAAQELHAWLRARRPLRLQA